MNQRADPSPASRRSARIGLLFGMVAYSFWGVLPIYFKLLHAVSPVAIVAHRVCWSLVVLVILLTLTRGWPSVRAGLANRRTMLMLCGSAFLIAVNWLLYGYAVNNGHILAGSLGYYLNPIANILLGRFVLGERLGRLQWGAVAIAAAGIAVLAAGALDQLWISLLLCLSFSGYGLLRKIVAADALSGLAIETALLFPFAFGWLIVMQARGDAMLPADRHLTLLLLLSGVITTAPLLLFTEAARRLPYSTVGMLQFLAPTLQLLVAVFLYGEPFTRSHAIAFAAIWTAIALYVAALVIAARRPALRDPRDAAMLGEC